MKLNLVEIHKSLSKAYLKQDLNSEQIDNLKSNLKILFTKSDIAESKKEHEEHFKNIVSDFLKDTYYKNDYEINISKRKDLVIHIDKASSDAIGVIIEAKKPSNEVEMISQKFPNAKALHELLHYYMQERFINDNKELKHLIATITYDWFIFDSADFDDNLFNKFSEFAKAKKDSFSNSELHVLQLIPNHHTFLELFNLSFKYGENINDKEFYYFKDFDNYMNLLIDPENSDYSLFEPNWICEYSTMHYHNYLKNFPIVNQKVYEYLKENTNNEIEKAYLHIF